MPRRRGTLRHALPAIGGLTGTLCLAAAHATTPAAGITAAHAAPDTRVLRLQSDLAAQPSATAVLQARCDALALPGTPRITATLLPGAAPAPDDVRADLAVDAGTRIAGRHVVLACGPIVLSEAMNWYVPGRLTPEMNHALETTHIPFGRAVVALHFSRETLSSTVVPPDNSRDAVLENRGLLRRASDNAPIAYVLETYRRGAL